MLKYGVLGPLQVTADGREVTVAGLRTRQILAMLVLHANQVVSVPRLVEATWGDEAPATARRQVQNRIAGLRATLMVRGGVIETHPAGYRLRAGPAQLDLVVFHELVSSANTASDNSRRAALLRQSLALWRGPALSGLDGIALASEASALNERRAATLADCLDLEIEAGQGAQLLPELVSLVSEYPLQERFVGQLMVALCRAGRPGDALAAYQQLRGRLVEQLGIEPSPPLRRLQLAVLGGEPVGGGASPEPRIPSRPPVTGQLPGDISGFVGRADEVAQIEALTAAAERAGEVLIVAIHGVGGVGKSALAIHVAHRLADRFPDGHLYVDLQGATPDSTPVPPEAALSRFLAALGVDGRRIPSEPAEAGAVYRSETAHRRLLLVLDNARDTAQVRAVVPTAPGSLVLVTSRRVLAGVDGAHHLHLDTVPAAEAMIHLARAAGQERLDAEPEAAALVARYCGGLPLALRIAGARLAARPNWMVATLATKLADAERRLDELELADLAVRTSLAGSYQELRDSLDPTDQAAAAGFVLLSQLAGADLGVAAAARLLDHGEQFTERALERGVDANLVESPQPGRYRLHDLLRLYAREQLDRVDRLWPDPAPITRAISYYAATSWRACAIIRPGDYRLARADPRLAAGGTDLPDLSAALGWMEQEHQNLVAAARQAAQTPGVPAELATQLAHAMFAFCRLRGYWSLAAEVNEVAVATAQAAGDRPGQALAGNDLGTALGQLGRSREALTQLRAAYATFHELGHRPGLAMSLNSIGVLHDLLGRYEQALVHYDQALAINEELSDRRGQAMNLGNIGPIYRRLERYDDALACHRRAMELFTALADQYGQTVSLANLGTLFARMGRHHDALDCLRKSLAIYQQLGDRFGQAVSLRQLGVVFRELGAGGQALHHHHQSLMICRELNRRDGEAAALWELGLTLRSTGRQDRARDCWQVAAAILDNLQCADARKVRALLTAGGPDQQGRAQGRFDRTGRQPWPGG